MLTIEIDAGEVDFEEAVEELDDSLITIINKRFQVTNTILCAIVDTKSDKLPESLRQDYATYSCVMVELGKPLEKHVLVVNNLPQEGHLSSRVPLHRKIDLNPACHGRVAEFRSLEPQQISLVVYCANEEDLREASEQLKRDHLRGFKQRTMLERDPSFESEFVLMCVFGKRD